MSLSPGSARRLALPRIRRPAGCLSWASITDAVVRATASDAVTSEWGHHAGTDRGKNRRLERAAPKGRGARLACAGRRGLRGRAHDPVDERAAVRRRAVRTGPADPEPAERQVPARRERADPGAVARRDVRPRPR